MSVFAWPARVYWEDTDGGGIVYHANYLRYLERARTEWLRSLEHSQRTLLEREQLIFTVVSLEIRYLKPARLDDELLVTCEPQGAAPASMRLAQRVLRPEAASAPRLLAEAQVRIACLDAGSLRPRRLPDFLSLDELVTGERIDG